VKKSEFQDQQKGRTEDMSRSLLFVSSFVLLTSLSCGDTNLLQYSGSRKTDQALLESGIKYINAGDYDSAIADLTKITSGFRLQEKVVKALTGAYAGKCGFDFITFTGDIGGASANTAMEILMSAFTTVAVSPSHCYLAQQTLEEAYGTVSASRPSDINFYLALLGMARVGTQLREVGDSDGDGVVGPGFASACEAAADISDLQVKYVGSGLGLLFDNIAAITAAVSGSDALDDLQLMSVACGAACTITDPNSASWDGPTMNLMRDMIETDGFGIMGCNNADPTTCCP
jgi:hypothetical protein